MADKQLINGQITILHLSTFEPWGPRRLEPDMDGKYKEVGGHNTCFFKITGQGIVSYYAIDVELDAQKVFKEQDITIEQYVLENFSMAKHLDTVKVRG